MLILALLMMISPVYGGYILGDEDVNNTSVKHKKLTKRGKKNRFKRIKSKIKNLFKLKKEDSPTGEGNRYGTIAIRLLLATVILALLSFAYGFLVLAYTASFLGFLAAVIGIVKDKRKARALFVLVIYGISYLIGFLVRRNQ